MPLALPRQHPELKNIVERAALLIDGDGDRPRHLPPALARQDRRLSPRQPKKYGDMGRQPALGCAAIRSGLHPEPASRSGLEYQSRAAKLLQISRRILVEKLQRYAIRHPERRPSDVFADQTALAGRVDQDRASPCWCEPHPLGFRDVRPAIAGPAAVRRRAGPVADGGEGLPPGRILDLACQSQPPRCWWRGMPGSPGGAPVAAHGLELDLRRSP